MLNTEEADSKLKFLSMNSGLYFHQNLYKPLQNYQFTVFSLQKD